MSRGERIRTPPATITCPVPVSTVRGEVESTAVLTIQWRMYWGLETSISNFVQKKDLSREKRRQGPTRRKRKLQHWYPPVFAGLSLWDFSKTLRTHEKVKSCAFQPN